MSENKQGNLKISGTGYTSGGSFDRVSVSGAGKIDGDLDCNDFNISGSCDISGSVSTGTGKVSGAAVITGGLTADLFKTSGSLTVRGDVSVRQLNISGELKSDGAFKADSIHVWGVVSSGKDVDAEEFSVNGLFKIGGMLNAEKIDVTLSHSKSSVKEIGGGQITVKRHLISSGIGSIIKNIFTLPFQSSLEAGSIEGDEIYLENTKAAVVRGSRITLGPGCEIGLIEYREAYTADNDSIVKDARKI